jgi:hypothetical protein
MDNYIRLKDDEAQEQSRSAYSIISNVGPEWYDLKDWASVFLAVMCYRRGQFQETLYLLDKTTNYQLVLHTGRFAFFTLLKAKSLQKLGLIEDSLKALNRRQVRTV